MKILYINTSLIHSEVVIVENNYIKGINMLNFGEKHSITLMDQISYLLKNAKCTLNNFDAIAANIGPGSFTGIRIAMGTVAGMILSTGLPLICVDSLESFAFGNIGKILVLIDAKKNEFYWGLFDNNFDKITKITDYNVSTFDFIYDSIINKYDIEKIILGGTSEINLLKYEKIQNKFTNLQSLVINGSLLAYKKLLNKDFVELDNFQPLYIRKSDAEIKKTINN